ncbi:hypothetical protein Pyn_10158 [Prunus yedoensis var. nudiflora]|uniref:Uncharacterized protein n=1 Tax=Prunus yedoensis var. nudiflora TaxID=2094558 RepID=A0A314XL82_PRUYE|nr:hypothetical protein Pyn_10158 [Prunus yedoensis var. nudiflora]
MKYRGAEADGALGKSGGQTAATLVSLLPTCSEEIRGPPIFWWDAPQLLSPETTAALVPCSSRRSSADRLCLAPPPYLLHLL